MAVLPARHTGRILTLTDPSGEFEDIYERMGQLMNAASEDLAALPADVPWSPRALQRPASPQLTPGRPVRVPHHLPRRHQGHRGARGACRRHPDHRGAEVGGSQA
jgi:hypothetical protein